MASGEAARKVDIVERSRDAHEEEMVGGRRSRIDGAGRWAGGLHKERRGRSKRSCDRKGSNMLSHPTMQLSFEVCI